MNTLYISLIAASGLIFLWVIYAYNLLVRLKVRVEGAWRQIDVQLKRRHDLIPNLVEAVRGYMKYEQETLERVLKVRSMAINARTKDESIKAENELSGALTRLFALMENYPELKANENVLTLQEELISTENRIAYARQLYNDLAVQYNTRQEIFPSSIIARIFGFKPASYFNVGEEEREVVKVNLT